MLAQQNSQRQPVGKMDFSTVPSRSTVTSRFITLTRPSVVTALAKIPLTNREVGWVAVKWLAISKSTGYWIPRVETHAGISTPSRVASHHPKIAFASHPVC